eukprot:12045643-Alexandrium_andersonii.AAC.1
MCSERPTSARSRGSNACLTGANSQTVFGHARMSSVRPTGSLMGRKPPDAVVASTPPSMRGPRSPDWWVGPLLLER